MTEYNHELWLQNGMEGAEEEMQEKYKYFMRPDPGQRKIVGPIHTEFDELTGRKMRWREARIGMMRGVAEESLKAMRVYLDPYPHVRLDGVKPLQGWYADKTSESGRNRPRPCCTEAVLTSPYGGACGVSCRFSLPAGELVNTPTGHKPIEVFQVGDYVFGRDNEGLAETKVTGVSKHWKSEGYVELTLSDERVLRLTADHPVYSVSRNAWVNAGDLLRREELEYISAANNLTVEKITHVDGGLYVYDIETETQNFYQRGVLVHNCYINSGTRGYRGSGLTTVPLHYGEYVRKTLAKMKTSAAGYFSSFTEPFAVLEDYYHNCQQGAQAFVDNGLPIFFLSRLRYPDWAVEQLQQNKYSYAQKSINTPDPKLWAKLSPGALPLLDHFKDIRRLKKAGIYISIQVNPILPGIVDHKDIVKLIEKLADAGADHVITKFVETAYPWAPSMVESVRKGFGAAAAERFAGLFTQNIGGQRTIDEDYRMEGHRLYSAAAKRSGITYSLCYEYKYARDKEGNIINKVGINANFDFMTSDQCHGHRVPMYSRDDLSKPFTEVKVCPPVGCLTCGDKSKTGLGKCGSELYSAARALTLAEMKHSVHEKGPIKGTRTDLVQIGGGSVSTE